MYDAVLGIKDKSAEPLWLAQFPFLPLGGRDSFWPLGGSSANFFHSPKIDPDWRSFCQRKKQKKITHIVVSSHEPEFDRLMLTPQYECAVIISMDECSQVTTHTPLSTVCGSVLEYA